MQLRVGQIVISRAGRDTTKVYMVVGVQKDRVLLADGGKRPLSAPKTKNIRHVNPTNTCLGQAEAESDDTLRAALKAFAEQLPATQGG